MSTTDPLDDENNALAAFEQEILQTLKPEAEDPVLDTQADASPAPSEQTQAAPSPSPAAPAASPAPAAPAPEPAPQGTGDPRAALRAARRSERQAREEAETLRRELAELRAKAPAPPVDPVMARLERELPEAAQMFKDLTKKVEAITAPAAAPATAEPTFVPDALPAELQAAVDKIDQLSDWQHDPDQTAWTLAKAADGMLSKHPAWRDKPHDERLAEVARRVASELGTPAAPAPSPATVAARVIDKTATLSIETLSDLRSGAAPTSTSEPDFGAMTPEEITAALDRLGRG